MLQRTKRQVSRAKEKGMERDVKRRKLVGLMMDGITASRIAV
jgi:hypothetical protein